MLTILCQGHKIEIDTLPMQLVFYDGREVSKKAAITGPSTHLFSVNEDDVETKYEVNISSMLGGSTSTRSGRGYEVRRNGKIAFKSNASTFTISYKEHKIELKEKRSQVLGPVLQRINKAVYYDGKEMAVDNNILLLGDHNLSFKVVENGEEIDYEVVIHYFTKFQMNYKVRRNGELLLFSDSSMAPSNASSAVDGGSKVVGNIAGGVAGGIATGGAGTAHGLSSGVTSGLANSVLKNPELSKGIESVNTIAGVVKKLSDKK